MVKPIDFKSIAGGKSADKEQEDALKTLMEGLPMLMDFMEAKAKLLKQYHENLLKEGFSEEEALEIVKTDKTFGI